MTLHVSTVSFGGSMSQVRQTVCVHGGAAQLAVRAHRCPQKNGDAWLATGRGDATRILFQLSLC